MHESVINQHEPQHYAIRTTFNIPEAPEEAKILGFKKGLPGVPEVDPFYQFETDRLRDLTMFWVGGFKALLVEGDPSAGKSSFIEQWHARLNVPLDKVACSPDIQNYQLIGQFVPQADGTLKWNDGPVVKACRQGTSVLLDEYNTLEPGQATALNLLLEGYSFTIPETGELIKPAPTTRFFAAQNSVDSVAAVSGRNVMDVANEDRFFYMEVDYLRPELEEALVYRTLVAGKVKDDVARNLAKLTVEIANVVRQAFRDGVEGIEKPISTRAVLKWAKLTSMYTPAMASKRRSALHYAIRRALKMSLTMTKAVNEFITLKAGFNEDLEN